MRALKTVRLRLRSLFRRRRVEEELDEELRDHLERHIDMYIAAGMSRPDARAAAMRAFGNVAMFREQVQDAHRVRWIDDLGRDVVYALRSIRRTPAHTAVTVLSLALAIGANTATFSLVNTLLLRGLPVEDAGQLVELGFERPAGLGNFSYPLYQRVRNENHTFQQLLAMSSPVVRAPDGTDVPPVGRYVSGNFFEALRLRPEIGRLLTPDDDRIDQQGSLVAVIGYGLWQRRFGRDPGVLGQTLNAGSGPFEAATRGYTIVGVLPRTFQGLTVGRPDDFFLPITTNARLGPRSLLGSPGAGWLKVVGRLRPDQSRDTVRAEVEVLYARFVDNLSAMATEAQLRQRRAQRVAVESARTGLSGPQREFGRPLLLLMGAVGLVLLVACANIVNLLLARGMTRRSEMAVRLAIGASRGRLVRQLLAESAVVGLLGGSLGLALAMWGTSGIATLMANEDPAVAYDVAPDGMVLLFTTVVSLGAALVAGLLPAVRLSRAKVPSLRGETPAGDAGGSVTAWTRSLIAAQVALSVLLLAGALLLVATLRHYRTGDFGFDREGVVTMRIGPGAGFTGERLVTYYRGALQWVRSQPGVRDATLSLGMPVISAGIDTRFRVEGRPRDPDALVFVNEVTDGYFATTGTRLLAGRDFGSQDGPGSPAVAIVNDAFARRYLQGRNVIGQRVDVGVRGVVEIVGVATTTKYESLREDDSPIIYVHALQRADLGALNLVVKTQGDPRRTGLPIREALNALGPARVGPVSVLASEIDRTLVRERLIARVLGAFALLALLLSGAGLYGVLAYSITRRTAEIGVRLALGATRGAVLWPVLTESMKLVTAGIAIGVPAALAQTQVLNSLLYGVSPRDFRVMGGVVLLLFVVALVAAAIPAWRASRVDPLVALRSE
jgi:putative ABC transport system permease protein